MMKTKKVDAPSPRSTQLTPHAVQHEMDILSSTLTQLKRDTAALQATVDANTARAKVLQNEWQVKYDWLQVWHTAEVQREAAEKAMQAEKEELRKTIVEQIRKVKEAQRLQKEKEDELRREEKDVQEEADRVLQQLLNLKERNLEPEVQTNEPGLVSVPVSDPMSTISKYFYKPENKKRKAKATTTETMKTTDPNTDTYVADKAETSEMTEVNNKAVKLVKISGKEPEVKELKLKETKEVNAKAPKATELLKEPKEAKRKAIPKAIRTMLWNTYFTDDSAKGTCEVCSTQIKITDFEVGHIQSVASGGTDHISNLTPLCGACNKSIGARNVLEFKCMYISGFI